MNSAYIDIIVFAVIAVFLFFKLRSVLGEVDEDSMSGSPKPTAKKSKTDDKSQRLAKLNPQTDSGEWPTPLPDFDLVANATAHNALVQVHAVVPAFNPYHFIDGARRAFEMIVIAFSNGDKKTLEPLLSAELFEAYAHVIDQRDKDQETWDTKIDDLMMTVISDAEISDDTLKMTVDYTAQERITARDKQGNVIDGHDGDKNIAKDRWVFCKSIKDKTEIWTLTDAQPLG